MYRGESLDHQAEVMYCGESLYHHYLSKKLTIYNRSCRLYILIENALTQHYSQIASIAEIVR